MGKGWKSMAPFRNRLNGYFTESEEESLNPYNEHFYQDMNNAACIIVGYLEIIQCRDITIDDQKKYLGRIHQEAYLINKLLNRYFKPN
jgi:hypothetical protein